MKNNKNKILRGKLTRVQVLSLVREEEEGRKDFAGEVMRRGCIISTLSENIKRQGRIYRLWPLGFKVCVSVRI